MEKALLKILSVDGDTSSDLLPVIERTTSNVRQCPAMFGFYMNHTHESRLGISKMSFDFLALPQGKKAKK